MKSQTFVACFVALLTVSPVAISGQPAGGNGDAINAQARTLELASLVAPIQSVGDLNGYLRKTPGSRNPLNALSPASRAAFLSSLTFSEKGLSSFNYAVLESELTYTQAYQVLALFGMQHLASRLDRAAVKTELDRQIKTSSNNLMATDYKDYRCISHATCAPSETLICTGNC